jgi:hypothetical protein
MSITAQLAGAASTWYRDCFQLKRSNGFYEKGVYRRINSELSNHRGNIQPASKAQVERLPEGMRADGAISIFTDLVMRTADPPNQVADRVMVKGIEYEVGDVERWASYNEYVCAKVGQ